MSTLDTINTIDIAPWMEHPLPTRPALTASAVVIPCDSPEHAERLARLLREMARLPPYTLTTAQRMILAACDRAEVR